MLNLEQHCGGIDMNLEKIEERVRNNKIPVVAIDKCPDCDKVEFEWLDDLSCDLSQGTGNVIIRYIYIPELDIVCTYADY